MTAEDVAAAKVDNVIVWTNDVRNMLEKVGRRKVEGRDRLKRIANMTREERYSTTDKRDVDALRALVNAVKKIDRNNYDAKRYGDQITDYNRNARVLGATDAEVRETLAEYMAISKGEKAAAPDPMKEARRKLIGNKIPGFFETPAELAARMVEIADLKKGDQVLEPSAGAGRIAEAAAKVVGKENVDVIEKQNTLREILEAQGFNPIADDFTTFQTDKRYDAVIMNPPFEKGQDMEHVVTALDFLKPGGRLVAIMSEGGFFRGDKQSTAFRGWLEDLGGTSEKLPVGTFKESGSNVATRLVTIVSRETKNRAEPGFSL